jgi:hypothetical protein
MGFPAFYEKNKIDIDLGSAVSITITDAVATDNGSSAVDYMRNRDNTSGWSTTDSTDAANTQIDVDMGAEYDITDIFLLQHNLKAYTLTYYNGSSYVAFSPAISETANSSADTHHNFTQVSARYLRLIITGAFTTDDDKFLSQFVVTKRIGQFKTGFNITSVVRSQSRKKQEMLSGKIWVSRTISHFECGFEKNNVTNQADINLIERLYDYYNGFLMWLCGDETGEYPVTAIGWRKRDLYLMQITTEYTPEWDGGFYRRGLNLKINMVEAI